MDGNQMIAKSDAGTCSKIVSLIPVPGSARNLLSYYRHQVQKCQIAAQEAPSEEQRDELQKMVRVWREFAGQHERMISEGAGQTDARSRQIPGWM